MRKNTVPLAVPLAVPCALLLLVAPSSAFAKGFAWSEKPALDGVPADGVRGEIDGRAVSISNITLARTPVAGAVFSSAMA